MLRLKSWKRLKDPSVYFGLSMISIIWIGTGLEIRSLFATAGVLTKWPIFLILIASALSILIALVSIRLARARKRLALSEVRLTRSKRQIREQSRRLKLTLENMSQGIAMADASGRIVIANRKLAEMLAPERSVRTTPFDHQIIEIIEASRAGQDTAATSTTGTYQCLNGSLLKVATVPVAGEGLVATFEDVTDRYNRQKRLKVAEQRATAASSAKSEFLASMSHEIRTPLHGIIGMSQVLLETSLDQDQRKALETIAGSGDALLTLINDILDYSRIEAGRVDLRLSSFDLRRLLDEIATLVGVQATTRNIRMNVKYPDDLGSTFVADAGRLRQIVINLVGNAVKFSTGSSVEIAVATVRSCGSDGISITVEDFGPGMSPDQLERIFDDFVQLDAPRNKVQSGTGLGLPIARKLAVLMGGTLEGESRAGVGSTFTVTLPLVPIAELTASPPELFGSPITFPASNQPAVSRIIRILVAEDNETNRQVLCSMLKTEPVEITLACDGHEAVGLFLETKPDIILMDVWMPGMDGFEATARIRELEREHGLAPIPIIALTANAVRGDRDKCMAAGMDDYMSKPLYKKVLVKMIGRWSAPTEERGNAALVPLYFGERRSLGNSNKSETSRESKGAILDELRIAALTVDVMPDGFNQAVQQFGYDVRQGIDSLQSTRLAADAIAFRATIGSIHSCALNMGCLNLAEVCNSVRTRSSQTGVIQNSEIKELATSFALAESELLEIVKKMSQPAQALAG